MPIDSQHPNYSSHLDQWTRCRDVTDGSDAVKARAEKYLPRLTGQSDEQYKAYKMRAYWFGGSSRTVEGLTGAVMRKDPTLEIPKMMDEFMKDVTQNGQTFPAFVKSTLSEVVMTGRYGVLVEMPKTEVIGAMPYWVPYRAEEIVNWQTEMRNGVPVLVFAVLYESVVVEDADDPYMLTAVDQYRELYLEEGRYAQQLWRRPKNTAGQEAKAWERYEEEIVPTLRGTPLDFIPFCFLGPTTITTAVEKSPILDLADCNLSHYRSSADLEHGRHFTALPTPWVAGFPATMSLSIGSSQAWVSDNENASAGMLEFTGQGLGALETAISDKKKDMAILGARLLESQQPSVEAADTLATRLAGEQSIVQSIANTCSVGFTKLLQYTAQWMGAAESVVDSISTKLNTELLDTKMTFAELTQLVQSWQSQAISYETMYYNMERGGITRPGVDWEKEKAQIEIEAPSPVPQNIDPLTGEPREDINPDGTPKAGSVPA
jgi:hypothetical protein